MPVILHIGRDKTGTSTLQSFLAANAAALRNQGIDYPALGRNEGFAHHFVARGLREPLDDDLVPAEVEATVVGLADEIRRNEKDDLTTLLSSEMFENCDPARVARAISAETRIVVYLRNQVEYLVSSYAQKVQTSKEARPFEQWADDTFRIDYPRFLGRWADTYGRESLTVRVFARSELVDGDTVADFLDVIGLDRRDGLVMPDRLNASIGGAFLEFRRRLNDTDFETFISPSRLRGLLQSASSHASPEINRGVVCSADFLPSVAKTYRSHNRRIRGEFVDKRQHAALNRFPDRIPTVDSAGVFVARFGEVVALIDEVSESDIGTRLLASVLA